MEEENGPEIFQGSTDVFGGITLATNEQNWSNSDEFKEMLIDSLDYWKKTSKRGVWIKVPLHQSDLVGIIAKLGFVFHHAEPDYVMMTRWLPEDEPNMLPGFATHYIGAGGFVLNEKNELLVIQELYAPKKRWKLPGGAIDLKEDIPNGVCREVLEETGISAEFQSICCFRHLHKFRFGRSDIYFVCHLRPLTSKIKMDPKEIAACRWMPIAEFLEHPEVHDTNRYFVRQCLASLSEDRQVSLRPEISNNWLVYSVLPKAKGTVLSAETSSAAPSAPLETSAAAAAFKASFTPLDTSLKTSDVPQKTSSAPLETPFSSLDTPCAPLVTSSAQPKTSSTVSSTDVGSLSEDLERTTLKSS